MVDILRIPDDVRVDMEETAGDAAVNFELEGRALRVYLTASESRPRFVCLRWNYRTREPVRVLGDKWERAYADLTWGSLNGETFLPWYFLAANGQETVGCGVMVQPNSFVSFEYDSSGVCAWFDVRCGAVGVELHGRKLLIGTVVCEHYADISAFDAAKEFCRVMSPHPLLPDEPVYGGNNWYYAYGKSSAAQIIEDAALQAELAQGCAVKPYMVIDSCWEMNDCAGPWMPNERFGDMSELAGQIERLGVKPGLWIRLLHDIGAEEAHPEWCLRKAENGKPEYLDPSHPDVRKYLRKTLQKVRGWGYKLLKHDFSTYDMFGSYGMSLNGTVTAHDGWSFYNRTRTGAEIVLDFYRLIRQETEGMVLIGCDTLSHLCAGLVELNRVSDDTSGKSWSRTRAIGVNGLAFRLPQNRSFYMVDADCVGIMENRINWKLNRQWLELLSGSGTPLFVSCQGGALTQEQKDEVHRAYQRASVQTDHARPLDWEYNNIPQQWDINGSVYDFDWVMDSYPALLKGNVQPY